MGINSVTSIFGLVFSLVAVAIVAVIIVIIVKAVAQGSRNRNSPELSVDAVCVTKRTNVWGGGQNSATYTDYYVTFEVQSGDRMEFKVSGSEYGMLAEGDRGCLTFKGTRYLGFQKYYVYGG